MNVEDRLRRAIAARTRSVEPSDDGLRRIHEKLLDTGDDMDITSTNRWYVIAAVAAVVLALAGGGLALAANDGGNDDRTSTANEPDRSDDEPDRTTTTSEATTTTTAPGTTTTTAGSGAGPEAPDSPPADAVPFIVWPRPSSEVRFDDPTAAASSWARFYAGFADPHLGEYRSGDGSSGEVPVFPLPGGQGAETTVNVRRFGDGHWYVVSSSTADITVTEPTFEDRLTCPQALRGTALAFEGTVQVRIDAYLPDGRRVEVGSTVVTGSGSPPAGPFEGQLGCTIPDGVEPYGIAHLFTGDEGDIGGNLVSVTFPIRLR